jgi:hypothetical protein
MQIDMNNRVKVSFEHKKEGGYYTKEGIEITIDMLMNNPHCIEDDCGWIMLKTETQPTSRTV